MCDTSSQQTIIQYIHYSLRDIGIDYRNRDLIQMLHSPSNSYYIQNMLITIQETYGRIYSEYLPCSIKPDKTVGSSVIVCVHGNVIVFVDILFFLDGLLACFVL